MAEVAQALRASLHQIKKITIIYHHSPAKQSLSPAEQDFKQIMLAAEIMLTSSLGLTLSRYPTVKLS